MFLRVRKRWTTRRCRVTLLTSSPALPWSLFIASVFYIIFTNKSVPYSMISSVTYRHGVEYVVVLDEDLNRYEDIPNIGSPPQAVEPELEATSPVELYEAYKRPSARCRKLVNMGGVGCTRRYEGNKDVCLDPAVVPPRNRCLVYSFGVADDVTFEDSLMMLLDCEVHLYDPTIRLVGWHLEKPRAKQIFHSEALSHRPILGYVMGQRAVMKTFDTLLALNGHTEATIHYLKIDIEGDEWQVLQHMIAYNLLDNVIQLSMELHSLDLQKMPQGLWMSTLKERFRILHSLEEIGFRRVSVQDNQHYLCRLPLAGTDTSSYATKIHVQSLNHSQPIGQSSKENLGGFGYVDNHFQNDKVGGDKLSKRLNETDFLRFENTTRVRSETESDGQNVNFESSLHGFLKSRNETTQNIPKAFDVNDVDGDENFVQVCQEVLYVRVAPRSSK